MAPLSVTKHNWLQKGILNKWASIIMRCSPLLLNSLLFGVFLLWLLSRAGFSSNLMYIMLFSMVPWMRKSSCNFLLFTLLLIPTKFVDFIIVFMNPNKLHDSGTQSFHQLSSLMVLFSPRPNIAFFFTIETTRSWHFCATSTTSSLLVYI